MTVNIYGKIKNKNQKVLNFIAEHMEAYPVRASNKEANKKAIKEFLNGSFSGVLSELDQDKLYTYKRIVGYSLEKLLPSVKIESIKKTRTGYAIVADYGTVFLANGKAYRTKANVGDQGVSLHKAEYDVTGDKVNAFASTGYTASGQFVVKDFTDFTVLFGSGTVEAPLFKFKADFNDSAVVIPKLISVSLPGIEDKLKMIGSLATYSNVVSIFRHDSVIVENNSIKVNRAAPAWAIGVIDTRIPLETEGVKILETMTEWGKVRAGVRAGAIYWAEWTESDGTVHFVDTVNDKLVK